MKSCSVEGCEGKHYGKGLCKQHYGRLRNMGTLDAIKVVDLPGEVWVMSEKPRLKDIYFSNMGRAKSAKQRNERLLKPSLVLTQSRATKALFVRPGCDVMVAPEVLRAFKGNPEGDSTVVYRDGDPENCRWDNLEWYGKGYLVDKAITMAEASNHPLADCFLKFWMGDHAAINDWLTSMVDPVRGYIYTCLRRVGFPWHLEIDDMVQQALYDIFIALYRGMFSGFETVERWVLSIAKAVYLRFMRFKASVPMEYDLSDGDTGYLPDWIGFCHPSAELQAIYNEEVPAC